MRITSPWRQLELFRLLASSVVTENRKDALNSAAQMHASLSFTLTMSFAVTLVSAFALFKTGTMLWTGQSAAPAAAAAVLGALASYLLRLTAARRWEAELVLVCSIAEYR